MNSSFNFTKLLDKLIALLENNMHKPAEIRLNASTLAQAFSNDSAQVACYMGTTGSDQFHYRTLPIAITPDLRTGEVAIASGLEGVLDKAPHFDPQTDDESTPLCWLEMQRLYVARGYYKVDTDTDTC